MENFIMKIYSYYSDGYNYTINDNNIIVDLTNEYFPIDDTCIESKPSFYIDFYDTNNNKIKETTIEFLALDSIEYKLSNNEFHSQNKQMVNCEFDIQIDGNNDEWYELFINKCILEWTVNKDYIKASKITIDYNIFHYT